MAGMGPQRSSRRQPNRGLGPAQIVVLPADGRTGPSPEWPMGGRKPAKLVADLWDQLWASPQAVQWEKLGWTRVVARYARCLLEAERRDAPAALLSEVRQLEDRLGLSPMSMLRLRWQIGTPEPETNQLALVTMMDDYRDVLG